MSPARKRKRKQQRRSRENRLLPLIAVLAIAILFLLYLRQEQPDGRRLPWDTPQPTAVVRIEFPSDRYPKTAQHIKKAIAKGESAVCTIDRKGAEENRSLSLRGIPTKKGYDRDEWPMAMCAEGGSGADIAYVPPADNRGAGSWIQNRLDDYPDGTAVEFVIP
ncbi:NucA/NucB deoxyribonuclease domain-containing protein [Gorillibacterium sp. sgz500922]|uniref:NucA/NucB deoxyribonuclease domain-containing protein n=1 Tax=Gorillibacterium sp. sgz500922 TaxID=3446694 RepID=UPI003F678729